MKGRKPQPSHLRLVKGNPGKRPMNAAEPVAVRERPSPPAHVSDKAREVWGYVSALLDDMGVLARPDAMALEMLCEAYADQLAARATLKEFGSSYYETRNEAGSIMHRAHPAVAVIADTDRRIKAWLAEFGMTPSSRSRINVPDGQRPEKDPAQAFFA